MFTCVRLLPSVVRQPMGSLSGGNCMSDANSGRRQPHRFEEHRYEELWQPVFFSGTTHKRRPFLTSRNVPAILTEALLQSAREHKCAVIAYSIMPDHLHYICCVVENGGNVRRMADWLKRVSGHRISRLGFKAPIWQRSYWDRHLRAHEKISHVVDYVLDNPVEEGLCAHRDEWPYSAFLGYPWENG